MPSFMGVHLFLIQKINAPFKRGIYNTTIREKMQRFFRISSEIFLFFRRTHSSTVQPGKRKHKIRRRTGLPKTVSRA